MYQSLTRIGLKDVVIDTQPKDNRDTEYSAQTTSIYHISVKFKVKTPYIYLHHGNDSSFDINSLSPDSNFRQYFYLQTSKNIRKMYIFWCKTNLTKRILAACSEIRENRI